MLREVNFDGLVGPTHHFGGLGVGNVASWSNRARASKPRAAAIEGLNKAWLVAQLGVPQILLPPLDRPNRALLSALGFRGSLSEQLRAAFEQAPHLLSAALSASAMWTANAATVSPLADCADRALHITPANLISSLHRASETAERAAMFRMLWRNSPDVVVHDPLPAIVPLRDEGAANHLRICDSTGRQGIEIFVSGDDDSGHVATQKFMVRQTRHTSLGIARLHQLDRLKTFHLQQSARAIDAGVFHNDVISTAHEHLWFYHQSAFVEEENVLGEIAMAFRRHCRSELHLICVGEHELSLERAVETYLFNSQIVTLPKNSAAERSRFHWIAPQQCADDEEAFRLLMRWQGDSSLGIEKVHFVSLPESMANGGGPACLRLRVSLDEHQLAALPAGIFLNLEQYQRVLEWIVKWYPERLLLQDLVDEALIEHLQQAVLAYPYRSYFVRPTRDEFNSIKLG